MWFKCLHVFVREEMNETGEWKTMICYWKEWVDSLERSNTKTVKKRGRFRSIFFLLFRKREKLYFSLFFSLFINTTTIVFDAEERVELFSDDTNNDQFCVYVTKSLWSNRIVLGNWNYNIRNCAEAIYTYIFFRKDVC